MKQTFISSTKTQYACFVIILSRLCAHFQQGTIKTVFCCMVYTAPKLEFIAWYGSSGGAREKFWGASAVKVPTMSGVNEFERIKPIVSAKKTKRKGHGYCESVAIA